MPKLPHTGFEIQFGEDDGGETLVPRSLKTDGSSGDNAAALDALRLMLDMRSPRVPIAAAARPASGQTSQLMTSAMGYGIRGQGQK